MSYFAETDEEGIVQRVIVADQDFIDSGKVGNSKNWIETSYETQGGIHKLDGSPLRKNYAGIGYSYDKVRDAFIPPKSFESWILNEEKGEYEASIERPKDGDFYDWDEATLDWVKT